MQKSDIRQFNVEITTQPYARLVRTFYDEYTHAFVLPDERESLSGFRICLSLNGQKGDVLHKDFGPSREYVGVLRGPEGEVAAGMNFICFPMPALGDVATVHSMYVFVTRAWRGRGLLRHVYQAMEHVARGYGAEHGIGTDTPLIFFGEQNDPFRMTLDAFKRDTRASGLDQFDRIAIWRRLGARALIFPYVQPALSAGGAADPTLFLRVLFRDEVGQADPPSVRHLDPRILREHLRRFFGITVLKGRCEPGSLAEIAAQESLLARAIAAGDPIITVRLPADEVLDEWKANIAKLSRQTDRGETVQVGTLLGISSVPETLVGRVGA